MSDIEKNWEKFLSAKRLKENLISISLFITTFELFKKRIIDMPKVFFTDEFDKDKGWLINQEEYAKDVLVKSKSLIYASLFWFKELGAIEQRDISKFDEIKRHRNDLVHNLFEFISNTQKELDVEKFLDLIELFIKIEKWWIINFECEINPELRNNKELKLDEVITPSQWQLKLLLDIALGNEPEENFYFNYFINNKSS
ncbi:hypothetical protein EDC44_1274 [Cricetibacter osteomyelitidis]|uniref:Uncharacterized protein n=1 Tax=Cricetibacter osteomyelitidis TaxID=1521931 RepID=A0A4V2T1A2_9PAST|nr:hypothetical protein [Cricetibacter osteomyelitidis]TCP92093.1 hypothetical protein EDC44_1274 [Cricetibacter osteomyelitidis]